MTNNNDNNNIAWSTHSSNFIRNTVGPTLLLIICPLIVNIFSSKNKLDQKLVKNFNYILLN